MEFEADIILFFHQIEVQNAENEINLDKIENQEYIRLKREKKEWKNSYSDMDINKLAKHKAMSVYDRLPVDKKIANHVMLYIDRLKQRKIDLQALDKRTRELI